MTSRVPLIINAGSSQIQELAIGEDLNLSGSNIATVINVTASGALSTTGNVVGGNVFASGLISTAGNVAAQGILSASGNIVTAGYFVGNFAGNITGNLVAPGSNTQILFNTSGNADAVAGLTYNKDSNVLTVLGNVASANVNASANISAVGNVTGAYILGN